MIRHPFPSPFPPFPPSLIITDSGGLVTSLHQIFSNSILQQYIPYLRIVASIINYSDSRKTPSPFPSPFLFPPIPTYPPPLPPNPFLLILEEKVNWVSKYNMLTPPSSKMIVCPKTPPKGVSGKFGKWLGLVFNYCVCVEIFPLSSSSFFLLSSPHFFPVDFYPKFRRRYWFMAQIWRWWPMARRRGC